MYFTGCADEREEQSVQSFVVEVDGTGVTVVPSFGLPRGFITMGRNWDLEAMIEENTHSDRAKRKHREGH